MSKCTLAFGTRLCSYVDDVIVIKNLPLFYIELIKGSVIGHQLVKTTTETHIFVALYQHRRKINNSQRCLNFWEIDLLKKKEEITSEVCLKSQNRHR